MSSHPMHHELTDAELAQVQGGGLIGDAWRAVKKGVKKVGEAVIDAIEAILRRPPTTDWPPPGRPWPGY